MKHLIYRKNKKKPNANLVEEKPTIDRQVIRAFVDSLAEFGNLYAELAKC